MIPRLPFKAPSKLSLMNQNWGGNQESSAGMGEIMGGNKEEEEVGANYKRWGIVGLVP